jgi:hypothetical protein
LARLNLEQESPGLKGAKGEEGRSVGEGWRVGKRVLLPPSSEISLPLIYSRIGVRIPDPINLTVRGISRGIYRSCL